MKNLILFASFFIIPFYACTQTNCNSLPAKYPSYVNAISKIRNTKFLFSERANTSNSSFIKSAEFYSCDGKTGFLIISIKDRKYIHKSVPKNVWMQFKNANSLGQYYDRNIRGRYLFKL